MAMLYDTNRLPSFREYAANFLDNIGLPGAKQAYAAQTGYDAMSTFLPMWQAFRNLAYAVYIIMFVVIGIMIMFRTKVGGQTIVTIQSAIPNLLITLILITFSYAIVGFMIDLMYFMIYFIVYLAASANFLNGASGAQAMITRLMSYSAWSVIFEGRNGIVSAMALSLREALSGLGTGALGAVAGVVSFFTLEYLIVAIMMAIAMLKLMFALVKSYVMLIVQTITAPVQIMMNALPGSKAFSTWLKTTASYLIPFPVAGAMFIFAAIFIGNPTSSVWISADYDGTINPFGINENAAFYKDYGKGTWGKDAGGAIWMPPFTLTNSNILGPDIMRIIGLFIFLMTPAAVKMAQDWLQVKESPYTSEAFGTIGMGVNAGMVIPKWVVNHQQEEAQMRRQAALYNNVKSGGSPDGVRQAGDNAK